MNDRATGREWVTIAALLMAFFIVLNVISYVWFPFLPWFEQRDAGEQIVREQIDAEKAIQNYEWFREQWNDIQAQRAQIENLRDRHERFHDTYGNDSSEWPRDVREDHDRIQTRITGNQNALEQMVAEYNARSDQAHREMFKCHLPYKVDNRFQITGPPGSGAPEQPQDEYVEGADPSKSPPGPEQCDGLPDDVNQGQ